MLPHTIQRRICYELYAYYRIRNSQNRGASRASFLTSERLQETFSLEQSTGYLPQEKRLLFKTFIVRSYTDLVEVDSEFLRQKGKKGQQAHEMCGRFNISAN